MRVLVLANTPAHVHLYRHAVTQLLDRGHDVLVLGRDDGCALTLLEYFDLPYRSYGQHRSHRTPISFCRSLLDQFVTIGRLARAFDPDIVFGRGPYAAAAGSVARAPVALVLDDEPTAVNHTISRPFADCIISPAATRRDLGTKHLTFDGFTECAYLHPAVYEPDPSIRSALPVEKEEPFALVRFNAHEALHDSGLRGFTESQRIDLLEHLCERGTVLVSDEGTNLPLEATAARPFDVHPARIHDALAAANLFVSDTGTMAVEAGLLGTPSIRYRGTDEREYGEFATLEDANLLEQYDSYETVRGRAGELFADPTASERWQERRSSFVPELANLTEIIVTVAEGAGSRHLARRKTSLTPRQGVGR